MSFGPDTEKTAQPAMSNKRVVKATRKGQENAGPKMKKGRNQDDEVERGHPLAAVGMKRKPSIRWKIYKIGKH